MHFPALEAARKRKADLLAEAEAVLNRAGDTLEGDDRADYDRLAAEIEATNETIASCERLATQAAKPSATKPAFEVNVNLNRGAYDDASDDPIHVRARAAVEQNDRADDRAKEAAVRLIERAADDERDAIGTHLYRATDPAYITAFEKFARNPDYFKADLTSDEAHAWQSVNRWFRAGDRGAPTFGPAALRTAFTTANTAAYLIPQHLDPTIVLTNASTMSDVRAIAGHAQTTVDQWDGVTSAGVTAEWLAEGTEVADATPTMVAPTITVHKGAAFVQGTFEALMDSGFDEVTALIRDAKDRLEAPAFISGTGSGQPYGLITRLSGTGPVVLGTSGDEGAADLTTDDPYALDDALGARWRPNARFLAAKPTYNALRKLAAELPSQTMWSDMGQGQPASLIGYPANRAEDIDSTIVSGSNDYVVVLGDFQAGYKIVDRIGLTVSYVPHLFGNNGLPTFTAGWAAFWRVGADVITSNAFKVLKL